MNHIFKNIVRITALFFFIGIDALIQMSNAQTYSILEGLPTSSAIFGEAESSFVAGHSSIYRNPSFLNHKLEKKYHIALSSMAEHVKNAISAESAVLTNAEFGYSLSENQGVFVGVRHLRIPRIASLSPKEFTVDAGYVHALDRWSFFGSVGYAYSKYWTYHITGLFTMGASYTCELQTFKAHSRLEGTIKISDIGIPIGKGQGHVPTSVVGAMKYAVCPSSNQIYSIAVYARSFLFAQSRCTDAGFAIEGFFFNKVALRTGMQKNWDNYSSFCRTLVGGTCNISSRLAITLDAAYAMNQKNTAPCSLQVGLNIGF